MHRYKINIRKISGRLNESAIPSKTLIIKSKRRISSNKAFVVVENYLKNKYGLKLREANIIGEGFFSNLFDKKKETKTVRPQNQQKEVSISEFPRLVKDTVTPIIFTPRGEIHLDYLKSFFSKYSKVVALIEILSDAYTKEFYAAKEWADELKRTIEDAKDEKAINEGVNKVMDYGRIKEYYTHTEESTGRLFDAVEETGIHNGHDQNPFLTKDDEKIIRFIEKFENTCTSVATQKGLKSQYVDKIKTIINKILYHYKEAKLLRVVFDKKTEYQKSLMTRIFKALSIW